MFNVDIIHDRYYSCMPLTAKALAELFGERDNNPFWTANVS